MTPLFVKGDLRISVDGQDFQFLNQNISPFGVNGLPWKSLSPETHFGRRVSVAITVRGPVPLSLKAQATLTREQTQFAQHMGLRFHWVPEEKERLTKRITESGFSPTEYIRKYPRIPSTNLIQIFPLRALAKLEADKKDDDPDLHHDYVFDVENLSPNGLLVSTENQMALALQPGNRLKLVLEPRGWFPTPVQVHGIICRISDDINDPNGNRVRRIGIKFLQIGDHHRTAFITLLKDILEGISEAGSKNSKS